MNHDILKLINENTWIASDHHFGHKKICEFEPKRCSAAKELGFQSHEDMLIYNHNKLVRPEDVVLFLGDFSFNSPALPASKLAGRKILILGNHDQRGDTAYYAAGFDFIIRGTYVNINNNLFHCHSDDANQSMLIADINGNRIAFTHYPLGFDDEYNRQDKGNIQRRMEYSMQLAKDFDVYKIFHGHLHSKLATSQFFDYINVSLEHTNFKPKRIGELL